MIKLEDDRCRKEKLNVFLYFVVIIANLTSFTCGVAFGWSSPITTKLSDVRRNSIGMVLNDDELSWIVALVALGAVIGPFLGGYLADKIGRKRTFIVSMLPVVLSFLLLAFANNLYIYYAARFVTGICVGICLTVVPMYVGEIAEVHNRGLLGCLTVFFITIGYLYSLIIGPYMQIKWFNLFCTIIGIVFLLMCPLLMPESPYYWISKGKYDQARDSLQKLRRGSVQDELEDITAIVKQSSLESGSLFEILKTKHLRRALTLSMGLMTIQQLTAISIINFYLQLIFENAGSTIPSEISAIIIGIVQTLATFLAAVVVDRLGRRPLLLCSTIATSLCLFILSVYFYLLDFDVPNISWLPITTLIVYVTCYSIGTGPLAYAIMGEIYLPHVKSTASSLSVACCFFFSFASTKLFPFMVSYIGNWFAFLFFAVGNTLGVIFIWFCLPETKGKTLIEITERFK